MHVCPQFINFPISILAIALYILADSSTIVGLFPPNSRIQGVRFFAAAEATSFPVAVDPVKQMISNYKFVRAFATSTFPSKHRKYTK